MPEEVPADEIATNAAVHDTIRAKRFELVGADGKVAAVLGVIDKHPSDSEFVSGGNLGLAILDEKGHPQMRLVGKHPDHFVAKEGLVIYNNDGTVCTNIHSGIGLGGLMVTSQSGISIAIGSQDGGAPTVRIIEDKDFGTRLFIDASKIEIRATDGTQKFVTPT